MKRSKLLILLLFACNLYISAQEKLQQDFTGVQIECSLDKNLAIELQSCIGNKFAQIVHIRMLLTQRIDHQVIAIVNAVATDENGNKYKIYPYGGISNEYKVAKSHPRKIPMQVNQILSSVSKFEKLEFDVFFTKYRKGTVVMRNVPILWK